MTDSVPSLLLSRPLFAPHRFRHFCPPPLSGSLSSLLSPVTPLCVRVFKCVCQCQQGFPVLQSLQRSPAVCVMLMTRKDNCRRPDTILSSHCVWVCVYLSACVSRNLHRIRILYMHSLMLFVTSKNAEEEAKGFSSAREPGFTLQSHQRQPSEPRSVAQEPPETQEQGQRGG